MVLIRSSNNIEQLPVKQIAVTIHQLQAYFGNNQVLESIDLQIPKGEITAIMGPSGCGKSTLLKCINGANNEVPTFNANGSIELHQDGFAGFNVLSGKKISDIEQSTITLVQSILARISEKESGFDFERLRREVGMVYQKPIMFPNLSLAENVLTGARKHPIIKSSDDAQKILERSLKQAGIWDEVKGILEDTQGLSGGQEQRMNIARTLATDPSVILMDEPTSKLDPENSPKVEATIKALKEAGKTVIIVTHNGAQAVRLSDNIIFLHQGKVIEKGLTADIAERPEHPLTRIFLKGSTLKPLPIKSNFKDENQWRAQVAVELKKLDILDHVCHEIGLIATQLSTADIEAINETIVAEKNIWIEKIKTLKTNPDMIITFITNIVLEAHRERLKLAKKHNSKPDTAISVA